MLDVAITNADHLREAGRRGLIPADAATWPGLEQIVARKAKARTLMATLGQN